MYYAGKIRKASAIPNFKVEGIDLPCKMPKNVKADGGVYLMRYMETYKGAVKTWDPHLSDTNVCLIQPSS